MGGLVSRRRKILFISPVHPFPLDAGWKLRVFNLVQSCSRDHDVTLVGPVPDGGDPSTYPPLPGIDVRYATRTRQSSGRIARYLQHLVRRRDLVSLRVFLELRSFEAAMAGLDLEDFDLVWVERMYLASLVRGREGKAIVDLDDVVHRKVWRQATADDNPLRTLAMVPKVCGHLVREALLARRYLAAVVSSDEDNAHLRAFGLRNVRTIPNGVEIGKRRPRRGRRTVAPRIVFVGNMQYDPNRDGLDFFVREVLPALRASNPDLCLDVIGPGAEAAMQERFAGAVRFLGFVEDLGLALSTYDVFVAPLRLGGGTKLKVLAAMGNGIPIVTTPVGAEGLGLEHRVSALIRNSGPEIADAIVALREDPDLGLALSDRAYDLAVQRFRWESIREATADWLRQMTLPSQTAQPAR